MNSEVVTQAAAGLAAYIKEQRLLGPVVIGYDARHHSHQFALDSAEVFAAAGLEALLLPRALPTPLLAFAILDLHACAGVMVTASHNPATDNGYKVYLGDGSQIVPPADAQIAAHIAAVGPVDAVPRSQDYTLLDDDIVGRYLATVTSVVSIRPSAYSTTDDRRLSSSEAAYRNQLRIAYTPMHGVGGELMLRAFHDAGFTAPAVVRVQAEPDPDFPTVAFPNPEEPGAMDLLFDLAELSDADIGIANDPNADRCAVAVPTPEGWGMLRGDDVGALLAHDLLGRGVQGIYATSIVSSRLLAAMAERHGVPYRQTLTGFKWIGRLDGLAFGYEEALGYCVDSDHVKDKDGLSAALAIADIAARAKAEGRTLLDLLDDIHQEYGVYASDQLSIRVSDLEEIARAMAHLRETPPSDFAGDPVLHSDDLSAGVDGLPPTDGLRYLLASGTRVIGRPSGTEPKLKCYLEVITDSKPAARAQLDALKEAVGYALEL